MPVNDINIAPDLFQRIANGDEAAFRIFFDAYRISLFTFAYEFTRSSTDAEDLVQEVFIKVWKNRTRLADLDEPLYYIFAMARNRIFDYLKITARDKKRLEEIWRRIQVNNEDPYLHVIMREETEVIDKAINCLPVNKAKVLRMSREQGMSHSQIAEAVGLSKSRIKNIIVESLKLIRNYLDKNAISIIVTPFSISLFIQ